MLLIVGILIGYLASSAISLLNFFSTQQGVHSYVIWGMGNFGGLTWERVIVFGALCAAGVAVAVMFVKPLNALLLGRRYAESMGVNVRHTRNCLLMISGGLAAVATAFCGPIGFLGLVMPHVARFATGTSNHTRLLPATPLQGCRGVVVPLVERGLRWWPDYPDKCYYPGDCRADNYLCHCKGEEVVSCKL